MLDQYIYNQPGHLIRRAHQVAWSIFMDETKAFDMTPVQYSLLVAVGEFPSIDATRLSELIDIDRATIGNVVDRLEKRGLLVRSADVDDRRAKKISLTKAGRKLIEAVNKVRGKIGERILRRSTQPNAPRFSGSSASSSRSIRPKAGPAGTKASPGAAQAALAARPAGDQGPYPDRQPLTSKSGREANLSSVRPKRAGTDQVLERYSQLALISDCAAPVLRGTIALELAHPRDACIRKMFKLRD